MIKYLHVKEIHNEDAPNQLVPLWFNIFKPYSVIDIGCGTGTFLKVFKDLGCSVLGIDGSWVDPILLSENLKAEEFLSVNLEDQFPEIQKADLVLCLEVAEHLSEKKADQLVDYLISLSDRIIFSAAIPGQGGYNHVNEQWLNYWKEKFKTRAYQMLDIFRPIFWDNPKVFWWYRQNMVLFCNSDTIEGLDLQNLAIYSYTDLVHPELYLQKLKKIEEIYDGGLPWFQILNIIIKKFKRHIFLKTGKAQC